MFCSSGFSRLRYGRPYCTPTSRSAAAPARTRARIVRDPPQRASGSDGGGLVTDERADVVRLDDHGVDPGTLECDHLVARRDRNVRDRELSRRHVRKQLEHVVEWVRVAVVGLAREQHDLGIDVLERVLELLLVAHLDDAVEAELEHPRVVVGQTIPVVADRKSTRLNSSHVKISYAVFCLKKKNKK